MTNFLTTSEAGQVLGVNRSRVLQFILNGRLPAQRFGWQWMIKKQDLEKLKDRKPGRPKKGGRQHV